MKKIFCLLSIIFIMGCKSSSTINNEFKNLNYSQGISKAAAITIAQKHILDSSEKNLNISSAVIENENARHPCYFRITGKYSAKKTWIVRFGPKIGTSDFSNGLLLDYRYYVAVDRTTGEVLGEDGGLADTL